MTVITSITISFPFRWVVPPQFPSGKWWPPSHGEAHQTFQRFAKRQTSSGNSGMAGRGPQAVQQRPGQKSKRQPYPALHPLQTRRLLLHLLLFLRFRRGRLLSGPAHSSAATADGWRESRRRTKRGRGQEPKRKFQEEKDTESQ